MNGNDVNGVLASLEAASIHRPSEVKVASLLNTLPLKRLSRCKTSPCNWILYTNDAYPKSQLFIKSNYTSEGKIMCKLYLKRPLFYSGRGATPYRFSYSGHKPAFVAFVNGKVSEACYYEHGVYSRRDGLPALVKVDAFGLIKEEQFYEGGYKFRRNGQPTHLKYFNFEGERIGVIFESFKGSEGVRKGKKFKYRFTRINGEWTRQLLGPKERNPPLNKWGRSIKNFH